MYVECYNVGKMYDVGKMYNAWKIYYFGKKYYWCIQISKITNCLFFQHCYIGFLFINIQLLLFQIAKVVALSLFAFYFFFVSVLYISSWLLHFIAPHKVVVLARALSWSEVQ